MSLRFFSDQCVPAEISDALRLNGHSVLLLREVLPIRTLDPLVIAKAKELDRIFVSINGDFASTVLYPPEKYLGILSIQLHNRPEIIPDVMRQILSFTRDHPKQEFYHGKLLIAEAHRIRIRGLT